MKSVWIAFWMSLFLVPTAWADCEDNPTAEDDCDGDGYSADQGDCDDDNADVNPDVDEICDDGIDNNCDEVIDESCLEPIQEGELMGGSACGQSGGGLAWLMPLVFFRRRRQ